MKLLSLAVGIIGLVAIFLAATNVVIFKAPPINRIVGTLGHAQKDGLSQSDAAKASADAQKIREEYSAAFSTNHRIMLGLCGALLLTSICCFYCGRANQTPNKAPEPTP